MLAIHDSPLYYEISEGSGVVKRGRGGGATPPQLPQKNYLKKAKSVQKLGGGGGGTCYMLEAETD